MPGYRGKVVPCRLPQLKIATDLLAPAAKTSMEALKNYEQGLYAGSIPTAALSVNYLSSFIEKEPCPKSSCDKNSVMIALAWAAVISWRLNSVYKAYRATSTNRATLMISHTQPDNQHSSGTDRSLYSLEGSSHGIRFHWDRYIMG